MRTLKNLIAGIAVDSSSAEHLDLVTPFTGEVIARIPAGAAADVDEAVHEAVTAQRSWAALSVPERLSFIRRAGHTLSAHIDELAALESLEMGKPTPFAAETISGAIAGFVASADMAETYPFISDVTTKCDSSRAIVHRLPLGVVALIVPWNFPVAMVLGALGPLIAAGNTVVVKPSEKSPLSTFRVVELLDLPVGVVNLVHGDVRAGAPLTAHEQIALAHFTGSVEAGRSVGVATAKRLRRSILELGGNDPAYVDAGVDIDATANAVAMSTFLNTGQICTSSERIYVHRNVADGFVRALVEAAKGYLMVDSAEQPGLGPMVDDKQRGVVHAQVLEAVAQGATLECGGEIPDRVGFFYPATVLTGLSPDMRIMREETFGPVAPVTVVESFEEALSLANNSEFGLAATVYSSDPETIRRSIELNAAIIWINEWQGAGARMIYEPWGSSGMGVTGGEASIDAATRPVSVVSPRTEPLRHADKAAN